MNERSRRKRTELTHLPTPPPPPKETSARLGLEVQLCSITTFVSHGTRNLTRALSRNLALSTWGKPDEHDLRMIEPILLHQCVKCSGIRW